MKINPLTLVVLSSLAGGAAASLATTNVPDPVQLVEKIAGGDDIVITNQKLTGASTCAGLFFNGANVGPDFSDEGIILSTGNIKDVVGPNEAGATTTNHDKPGDADLDAILQKQGNFVTYDACVLEFDFMCPTGKTAFISNNVTFTYQFGSEEYNEYVGSAFNDVFGFFLTTEDSGGALTTANIAVVPGSAGEVAVAINTVNNGMNADLYMDNNVPGPDGKKPYNIEADGLTRPLPVMATASPNKVNHIKLAVADAGDKILDSWVFIEEGTFKCVWGGTSGDPHFYTWDGEMYDFHGGCDLVLMKHPAFAKGKGLDIHVRTKIETWWSYIDSAVVRIGDDTFEMQGGFDDTWFWVNGKPNGKMEAGKPIRTKIGGYPVKVLQKGPNQRKVVIMLDRKSGESIVIKSFKDIVRVDVNPGIVSDFEGSVGLMGTFPEGKKIGRNGVTVFEDTDEFGQEWQVLGSEANMFHNVVGSQAPQKCTMPVQKSPKRRLADGGISREEAEEACAGVADGQWREACISDVIAMGDKDVAEAYDVDTGAAF